MAAIVGPYDKKNTGPPSSIGWFYVEHRGAGFKGATGTAERPETAGTAYTIQVRTLLFESDVLLGVFSFALSIPSRQGRFNCF